MAERGERRARGAVCCVASWPSGKAYRSDARRSAVERVAVQWSLDAITDDTPANPTRRDFLRASALAGAGLVLGGCSRSDAPGAASGTAASAAAAGPADASPGSHQVIELAPEVRSCTIGYNGSVPAPIIRLHEGRAVSVELINDTDTPELVHWHGQIVPSDIDGAIEEGTPVVPPRGSRREQTPRRNRPGLGAGPPCGRRARLCIGRVHREACHRLFRAREEPARQ